MSNTYSPAIAETQPAEEPSVGVLPAPLSKHNYYTIPLGYRKMENLHIVFWLFKDVAWCLNFKTLGIAMIFPTLIIALVIGWRTRSYMSERCHNLAIAVWISANSYWMVSEFLGFDGNILFGDITFKHLAIIPFVTGILILAFYYLYWQPRHKPELEQTRLKASD